MVNRKELKARFVIAKNHIFLKGFQTYKTIKHKIAKKITNHRYLSAFNSLKILK